MQLDWITIAAQIANFLILVWLLNRFLYGPITRAMKRRDEQIQSRLDDASEQKKKATTKQHELDDRLARIDEERDEKLDAARKEADELRRKLEQEARDEVDSKRAAWLAELQDARGDFIATLRTEVASGFREFAQDALGSLADTTLTERVAEAFQGRLKDLDGDELEKLRIAAEKADEVIIEAGHALDANTKRKLTRAVHDVLDDSSDVIYEDDREGLVGIRLRAGNFHIEWTLDSHLDRFADNLTAAFPERTSADRNAQDPDKKRKEDEAEAEQIGPEADDEHGARDGRRKSEAAHD